MNILTKCGGELENFLRRRCIMTCSTEEYINSLEDIATRAKIGTTCKKMDIEISNKPFIMKDKTREPFQPNKTNINEQRKSHKCGGIVQLDNNFLKKANINEILEREDHNDKEVEFDSEKETENSENSESDEINIINAQMNNVDLTYEVLDVNSNLPQVGKSDTSLTKIQDSKMHKTKPVKGMGYTDGESSICVLMVKKKRKN
ncbi:hypothetical protein O181_026538 [Austropuccinia psidii MF-1]|uniref:Uncharacterized protein n=1 Tax=Austropuccinia psidii MF-1 TaxID=1389203 RepID=A0A9Q3CPY9_9BASI|nr:hypothetical protein [Austropuccinia psidii MF-1]